MELELKTLTINGTVYTVAYPREEIQAQYEAGQKAEYDRFWDTFQQNGEKRSYAGAFQHGNWTDDIFHPKYPIVCEGGNAATNLFSYNTGITDTKVPITIKGGNANYTFNGMTKLVSIPSLTLVGVTSFTNTFANCRNLVDMNLYGQIGVSGLDLSKAVRLDQSSLIGVVGALSADTENLAVTVSSDAVNCAFQTAEGAADGTTSEDWLALVATKPNWTISLV